MTNPIYIMSAVPKEDSRLLNLFQSGENSLMHLLENPGSFRYAGWDLETLDQARIVEGEYLEVKNGDRKTIQLFEDGSLIYKAAADETFLAWGRDRASFVGNPKLNTLALIEVTTNFVHFYKKLIEYFEKKPGTIIFIVQFKDFFVGDKHMGLVPARVEEVIPRDIKYAIKSEMEKKIEIKSDELISEPSAVAYAIVEKIFTWFGVPVNLIPYVKEIQNKKYVDIEQWRNK
jgi:hypothetical protein